MVMVSGGTSASGLSPNMLGTCKGRLIGETLNQWLWAFFRLHACLDLFMVCLG